MTERDYRDWKDFTNRICRPIVEQEDQSEDAWVKFHQVSPYYLCVALVMALNETERRQNMVCDFPSCHKDATHISYHKRQNTQDVLAYWCDEHWEEALTYGDHDPG